ncbi:hypothetical protein, partial [Limosilactobacillus fermentum]|uniref:hypothetical protein n=1 Tax=Limosilactobacillus fermentum TaxID=1613 RepID=UPI0035581855
KLVHGESLRILIGFLAISIIRGRLSLFQYPQGINLHKIFYTPAKFVQKVTNQRCCYYFCPAKKGARALL